TTKPSWLQRPSPFNTGCPPTVRKPLLMINPSAIRKPSPSSSPLKYGPWKRLINPLPDMVLNLRTMVPLQSKLLLQKDDAGVTEPVNNGRPTWAGDERSCRTFAVNLIAPSVFNSPAPCSNTPNPFNV